MGVDKQHIGTSCGMGDDLLAYVFNEMSVDSRRVFERHLEVCFGCIDELAELAHARYSVYEWKTLEFDPTSTPRIVVPYQQFAAKPSFFEAIKASLGGFGWATGAAVAAVLSIAVLGSYLFSENREDLVARESDQPQVSVPGLPTPGVSSEEQKDGDEFLPAEIDEPTLTVRRKRHIANSKPASDRIKRKRLSEPKRSSISGDRVERQLERTASLDVERTDDGLRLAALFDELDTEEMD